MDAYEQAAFKKGYNLIAGVDEAGRGPLAGPVVAAAVIFKFPPPLHLGIRDSKTLSPSQRDNILLNIYREAVSVGVGVVWMDEIETTNIHAASLRAMADAVKKLNPSPQFILVDGPFPIKTISTSQLPIIKGDALSVSVAAASIVAKIVRDNIMAAYHNAFPQYNFIKNKGYGTSEHLAAIKYFGPSPIHRRGFKGVKEHLV
ncbi:MAG: ribonuclease HII [Deltaproteobacteria bacterium RIFCSPLOWO2_12_FULL_43_16]|nr:MAG: ribonuclease HII [Deltaproteobacteria bacterium GWA2_43_19]OGQ11811.1 MAG: ribonuclease HII [Deltaproteobacteria bacterium RIFCSPHIGHO2_02_FULL_43_33]OGQ37385.1 MAG: ribonuclease HII [Deltaproteobacteria bacterium RIFCSPLOWO2_01_FULL_42_9]OGQ61005.1 MAG: ribonuclease HII [Deltaproteobacteria bacterium RIFCSPLOWO2_12_FULL_43_16]HBR17412.1 ribonuclease HII [Deltaproteobacteria bacterium]